MPQQEREPAAELRTFAAQAREVFLALVEQGFSEQQALVIVGQIIAASLAAPPPE